MGGTSFFTINSTSRILVALLVDLVGLFCGLLFIFAPFLLGAGAGALANSYVAGKTGNQTLGKAAGVAAGAATAIGVGAGELTGVGAAVVEALGEALDFIVRTFAAIIFGIWYFITEKKLVSIGRQSKRMMGMITMGILGAIPIVNIFPVTTSGVIYMELQGWRDRKAAAAAESVKDEAQKRAQILAEQQEYLVRMQMFAQLRVQDMEAVQAEEAQARQMMNLEMMQLRALAANDNASDGEEEYLDAA